MVEISDNCVFQQECVCEVFGYGDLMNVTCQTIDLDKYELLDNSTASMGCDPCRECVPSDLWSDLLPIDAEIIDYGISEDELEENPPIPEEPAISSTKSSSATDKSDGALVNVSNVTSTSKIKSLCIKVVDCDKYPWYYAKYQNQILKRKYFVAVKQARSIVKSLKKNTSKPSIVIDLDDLSDSSDNFNNNIATHKAVSIKGQTMYEGKKYKKMCKTTENNFSEMTQIKKDACNSLTSSIVDLKRKQGLIGMKVQRIFENDKTKKKYTKEIGINKEKNRQQKDQHSSDFYVKAVDKIYENNTSDSTVYDNMKMNDNLYEKINQSKSDAINPQKTKNYKLEQTVTLSCDIEISSPKIVMKIKRITPDANENRHNPDIKKKYGDARLIADHHQDSRKYSTNHQQLSNDCNKVAKYKPMPKSKKNELEKLKNMEIRQDKLRNSEDHLNKHTGQYSMNDEKISAKTTTNETKKNKELNKSFLYENKSAEEIASKMTNKMSKTDHDTDYTKKKVVKKKKTIDQSQVSKSVEPPQAILSENVHNLSFGNKPEVGPKSSSIYNLSSLEEGLVSVSKQTLSSVDQKHKHYICPNPDRRDISLMNKTMSEYIFSGSRNESDQENTTLPILTNVARTKNNLTRLKELNKVNTRLKTTSKSPIAYKSMSNLMSSSSLLMSQQEKEASTKQVHKRKQPEYNLPVKKTNNIDFLKSNRVNESNIQSMIPSLQECSESREFIIPNVVNRPQKLSDFYCGPVKSNDGVEQNQMSENKQTQQSIVPVQDMKSTQYNYGPLQNPDEYIFSDNVKEQYTPSSVVNTSYIPQNMQESVPMMPPMMPIAPGATTRPNINLQSTYIIKSHYGIGFQRPPPQDARGSMFIPDFRPKFGQGSYAVRPQTPSKQVPRLRFDSYQQPSYACTPTNDNIYRMSYFPTTNITSNHNEQNNYAQPPIYNNMSFQKMPHNIHMPPGICDVQPNNVHWQYNIFNPAFPPPRQPPPQPPRPQQPAPPRKPPPPQQPPAPRQQLFQKPPPLLPPPQQPPAPRQQLFQKPPPLLPPPQQPPAPRQQLFQKPPPQLPPPQQPPRVQQPQSLLLPPQQPSPQLPPPFYKITSANYEKSSIIGKNETGLVKKINIPSPANSDLSKNVKTTNNNKGAVYKQKNTNTDANSRKYAEPANKAANVNIISNQSIIMQELQNIITVDTSEKLEAEKEFSKELFYKQVNYEQASIPGPLSKKIKLDHELTATRNTKPAGQLASQPTRNKIPKTGYSPPILPISTFQSILSGGVKLSPHNQPNVLTKSFKPGKTRPNSKVSTKKMLQSKQKKQSNQIVQREDDTY